MGNDDQVVRSTTEVPEYIRNRHQQNLTLGDAVTSRPYQALPGARIAPFTPDTLAGQNLVRGIANDGWGQQEVAQAYDVAGRVGNYNPLMVTAPTIGAVRDVSAPTIADIADIAAGQLANTNLNPYLNAGNRAVKDEAFKDMARNNEIAMRSVGSQAALQGAYGGARQGVAQAETARAYQDAAARTGAELDYRNYANAQQAALADIGNRLQADTTNRQLDWNRASQNASMAQQAALANQGMDWNRAALGANLGFAAQTANQAARAQGAGLNLQGAGLMAALGDQARTMRYDDAARLSGIGGAQQVLDQANIDQAVRDFQAQRQYPLDMLMFRQSLLTGTPSGSTTTQTQPGADPWSQGLGFLTGAAGLYGLASGQPIFNLFR